MAVSNYIAHKAVISISIINNINSMDLLKVYQESKSLDKTLEVIKKASHNNVGVVAMWNAMKNPKIVVEEGASKIVKLNK